MKKEELKKEFESGTVTITKDNIHLYYEFMSDEDAAKDHYYVNMLNYTFKDRLIATYRILNDDKAVKKTLKITKHQNNWIGLSIFGVKDTLKPIDEYIKEIKESSEYKEYRIDLVLESMSKEEILIMIESFEYYPAVTGDDDKSYIIAYLNDEACSVSRNEIYTYITTK